MLVTANKPDMPNLVLFPPVRAGMNSDNMYSACTWAKASQLVRKLQNAQDTGRQYCRLSSPFCC